MLSELLEMIALAVTRLSSLDDLYLQIAATCDSPNDRLIAEFSPFHVNYRRQ